MQNVGANKVYYGECENREYYDLPITSSEPNSFNAQAATIFLSGRASELVIGTSYVRLLLGGIRFLPSISELVSN